MTITFTGSCCEECLVYIANGDDIGDRRHRMLNVWTPDEVHHMVAGDKDLGFSWGRCDACEDAAAGERYEFSILAA